MGYKGFLVALASQNSKFISTVGSITSDVTLPTRASTGESGGFDFGLKHFLTNDAGETIQSPQYFSEDLPRLRQMHKQVAFQLAHDGCDRYDTMVFEDLNLAGMKRLWGRKVSDLGFAQFMQILDWVAFKRGKVVIRISRWEPTTPVCSNCGQRHCMALEEREYRCDCGLVMDRDHNAARNILEVGHRLMLSQSEEDSATVEHPAFTSEAHLL